MKIERLKARPERSNGVMDGKHGDDDEDRKVARPFSSPRLSLSRDPRKQPTVRTRWAATFLGQEPVTRGRVEDSSNLRQSEWRIMSHLWSGMQGSAASESSIQFISRSVTQSSPSTVDNSTFGELGQPLFFPSDELDDGHKRPWESDLILATCRKVRGPVFLLSIFKVQPT
jgi:hypothetical protein